jgi:hypothetical protein
MSDLLVVTTLGMREVIRLMSRLFIVTGNEGICLLVYKAQERVLPSDRAKQDTSRQDRDIRA